MMTVVTPTGKRRAAVVLQVFSVFKFPCQKKINTSETKMTARVLKQDPNT